MPVLGPRPNTPTGVSEPPQKAVDVIQFKLRSVELAGAAAEFVQDLAGALEVGLLRDADVVGVGAAEAGQGTAERVAAPVGLLHLLLARHLTGLLAHHHLLRHLLGHGLQALLKLIQRLGLGRNRRTGLALFKGLTGVPHGAFRAAQGAGDLAAHLTELTHHFTEFATQRFLLGGAG
jgi:hypothetical protein